MVFAVAPAQGTTYTAPAFLSESIVFDWSKQSFRADLVFMPAIALCLGVAIAAGHPGAGLIAGSGAMTVGLGAKQSIDDSRLLPMIFACMGMAACTFLGMIAGHKNFVLILVVTLAAFGYGMLTSRPGGYSWVGLQSVVYLLVASAFPFSPQAAGARASLILAGGAVQILSTTLFLKLFARLRQDILSMTRYARAEEDAFRVAYANLGRSVRDLQLHDSTLWYAVRLALTLAVSTEIYRRLHLSSGYWIPMTALLVLKPGLADTTNRAVARLIGTLTGAVLCSILITHTHPGSWALAALVVLFAWCAYSTLDVNYALFAVFLTSYIVCLLSLSSLPGSVVAYRRALCTVIGGVLALSVRIVVIRRRNRTIAGAAAHVEAVDPSGPGRDDRP